MTNGEKMQEMYPDIKILGESENTVEYSLDGKVHRVKKRWWNAEHPERKIRMTNREFFFKAFPCLKQDEEWPNLLWWIDEKGKRQLLGDIYDSNFWDAEYKEPTTKNDSVYNLCDSCTNIRCEFQSGIVRTKCAFYTSLHKSDTPIGEAIEDLRVIQANFNGETLCVELALDIMEKYKKIEQIVNSNPDYIHNTDMNTYKLNSIREVIEK